MREARVNRAYLSLGSNIDPEANLKAAVRLLSCYGRISTISSVWESAPYGFAAQPPFLNAALILETTLSAEELKETAIATVEANLIRIRGSNRNGPRTIDIDIMLFNNQILTVGARNIPDPDVLQRPYVAIPLAEIAPEYRHPVTGETLSQIAARFTPSEKEMRRRQEIRLSWVQESAL